MVEVLEVIWTEKFEKEVKKLRDNATKTRVIKDIDKIMENPEVGKPLRFALKGERTIRIAQYRLIYSLIGGKLYLLCFEHRSKVYE